MRDDVLLLLAFYAFVLWEGMSWAPVGSILWRRTLGPQYRFVAAGPNRTSRRGVLVAGWPLGDFYICPPWPCSISPMGLVHYVTASWLPHGRPEAETDFIALDQPGLRVTVDGALIRVGRTRLVCGSGRMARRVGRLLVDMRRREPAERGTLIETALREWIDPQEARRRHDAARPWLNTSQSLGIVLLVHLGVLTPLVIHFNGWSRTWSWLLAATIALVASQTVVFVVAHRRLGAAPTNRIAIALTIAVFPPAAVRARDYLALDLFGDLHPVAVALALAGEGTRSDLVSRLRRDLQHPVTPLAPLDESAREVVTWFDARLRAALGPLVGDAAESFQAVPGWVHCPRCGEQLLIGVAHCPDCGVATFP